MSAPPSRRLSVLQQPEETQFRWTDSAWLAEVHAWIRQAVAGCGLTLVGEIEQPHLRPWATAMTVPTDAGTLWFKASVEPLTFEVPLQKFLAAATPELVARVLAAEPNHGWMLMEDAGDQLAGLYGGQPPVALWCRFVAAYAQLQIDTAAAVDELVGAGVPDQRSPRLIQGFLSVLDDPRLVKPPTDDAMTDDELARLRALVPALQEAIGVVTALRLPDAIQHDDLHAWNVCVRDGRYRFIDWGDSSISQPLLSLYVPLAHADETPEAQAAIRDAYLGPWTALRPLDQLRAACDAAIMLAQLSGVLKWQLLSTGLSDAERAGYEDAVPRRLRHLLELTCG